MTSIQLGRFYQTKHDSDEYTYTVGYSPCMKNLIALVAFKCDDGPPIIVDYWMNNPVVIEVSAFTRNHHMAPLEPVFLWWGMETLAYLHKVLLNHLEIVAKRPKA